MKRRHRDDAAYLFPKENRVLTGHEGKIAAHGFSKEAVGGNFCVPAIVAVAASVHNSLLGMVIAFIMP